MDCEIDAEASHTHESRVGTPCGVAFAVQGLVQALCGWEEPWASTIEASRVR